MAERLPARKRIRVRLRGPKKLPLAPRNCFFIEDSTFPMQPHSAKPPLNSVNVVIFLGLPLAALLLVPAWGIYHGYDAFQWLWALAFLYLNGMSITGGYHRLWAHRAYDAHPALKWFFALWGAGALQNSILIWASDHRRHHRYVDDNERDRVALDRRDLAPRVGRDLRQPLPALRVERLRGHVRLREVGKPGHLCPPDSRGWTAPLPALEEAG